MNYLYCERSFVSFISVKIDWNSYAWSENKKETDEYIYTLNFYSFVRCRKKGCLIAVLDFDDSIDDLVEKPSFQHEFSSNK